MTAPAPKRPCVSCEDCGRQVFANSPAWRWLIGQRCRAPGCRGVLREGTLDDHVERLSRPAKRLGHP